MAVTMMNMKGMKTMIIDGVHMNDKGKPVDRFDLEQSIMEAWHVVDDLKLLVERSEYMNEDQMFSALHGLQIFADMRFDSLWNTFEQCISNGIFDDSTKRGAEIAQALDEATQGFGQEKL
jgi:hypothetical protein